MESISDRQRFILSQRVNCEYVHSPFSLVQPLKRKNPSITFKQMLPHYARTGAIGDRLVWRGWRGGGVTAPSPKWSANLVWLKHVTTLRKHKVTWNVVFLLHVRHHHFYKSFIQASLYERRYGPVQSRIIYGDDQEVILMRIHHWQKHIETFLSLFIT